MKIYPSNLNHKSLRSIKEILVLFLSFFNLSLVSVQAQYTLTDDDVVVTNGVIESCSYDFTVKDIIIPQTLDGQTVTGIADKSTDSGVFYSKGITSIQLPSTLIRIGNSAFVNNSLNNVTIPSNVTSIGDYAFYRNSLDNIIFPNSVTTIGAGAFYFNTLTSITIPNSVTSIGKGAFNMNSITQINDEPSNGIIYARNNDGSVNNSIIVSYGGVSKQIDFIPNYVTVIGNSAFSGIGLTSVTLPNSVTSIEKNAFANNIKLATVILPDPVIKEGYIFANWQNGSGNAVTEITDYYTNYEAQFTQTTAYTVSGSIDIDNITGVVLNITGDFESKRPVNDDSTFSFKLNAGRNIIITPVKKGYIFTPQDISISNIQNDMEGLSFTATIATAISKQLDLVFKVYPNPSDGIFDLLLPDELTNSRISVANISGNIVKSINTTDTDVTIDLRDQNNGIYFISVSNSNNTRTVKVIKKQ